MILTIGLVAALLFVGTLLLLAFRPDPPRVQDEGRGTNRKPPSGVTGSSRSMVAAATAPAASFPERELSDSGDPVSETPKSSPELPADFRSHDISRHLESRGYATLKDLFFYPGSPRLREDSTGEMAVVAALLFSEPGAVFEIEGSSNGSEFLARDRAEAVIDQLVGVYGVDRKQLIGRGRSAGTSNVARNRRVQVIKHG